MKNFFLFLILSVFISNSVTAQGYTIKLYQVNVQVNKDASLDITETLDVNFTESHHGIFRMIPFKYKLAALPQGSEKANRQLESNGYAHVLIEDIQVKDWNFSVSNNGSYKEIKIGSKNKYVYGQQQYVIKYKLLNAINFFNDKSELYLNIIGDKWDTDIDSVVFSVSLYDALPAAPAYFTATGYTGSRENNTTTYWTDNKILQGSTTKTLHANQGLTVGIVFPKDFLIQQNYMLRGIYWLLLPLVVLVVMFLVWYKWGKDAKLTITTEFYPPENVSPSIAGYVINDKLDRRDLTALIPYWGAGGYLRVKETQTNALMGLIKNKEYEFIKLKDIPGSAMSFEKTLFNGIFKGGNNVALSSLKNVLYKTMDKAKKELEKEVNKAAFYVKKSRGMGCLFPILGVVLLIYGIIHLLITWGYPFWFPLSLIVSGIIIIGFGIFMAKKTPKGNELYKKLAGFKEFIQSVEKERLSLFLKEDQHYFDKVLPFAIVFNVADAWKDKLKGLEVPPPSWYIGSYNGFTTSMFLNSLDHSMNEMSRSFYSAPSSSGSSGGSWSSGGGGFSGGGFGGGGGGAW
ncbi:MAG: DUF2207 domain-containing protein [Chitinophagaceae bacterium]|nr:DUF2207 domain-containing protein [Chitinophagaceae bacterium]